MWSCLASGSSPLTRGKLPRSGAPSRATGLIPAHAGKTWSCCRRSRTWMAHPRSRGENVHDEAANRGAEGSSPLTRGKRRAWVRWAWGCGLIPAHAGKTTTDTTYRPGLRAHPRSRGENTCTPAPFEVCVGSSPLTRGKRRRRDDVGNRGRLIPAHAGKTGGDHGSWSFLRAHPRSRGENEGSRRVAPVRRWLIPAHAGKTVVGPPWGWVSGAHPRSRGENEALAASDATDKGSSPLTRGKRNGRDGGSRRTGLIPAHAGKTRAVPEGPERFRAHPRSRGENLGGGRRPPDTRGSSPLTRGKRPGC